MTFNVDEVPGTTKLVEMDPLALEMHGSKNKRDDVILVPTPSDDPNDPLNWSRKRKYMHMFCLVVYVFSVGIPTTSIYSVLPAIVDATEMLLDTLNDGTGYMFLFLGIGCMIFLPLSLQFGKRPVYLFSLLACCLISIWQPYATTSGTWIGSKILQGFVAAAVEALPEVSISDVFFEHERATWMGVYAISVFGSNYLAPLVAGFIETGMGWKWVIYFSCIWNAVAFVFILVFMEESGYSRAPIKAIEKIKSIEEKNPQTINVNQVIDLEKTNSNISPILSTEEHINKEIPEKTFVEKLSFRSPSKKFLLFHYLFGPFQMCMFPVVLWSGFLYGSALIWYSVMNATLSLVLTSSPYNFSSNMTGVVYVSPLIFAIIFYSYAGWILDYLKIRLARRRNGLSLAEDRLWSLILYMILGPASLILWGVGAAHEVHWFGLVIGAGLMGGLAPIGCSVSVTYVVDTYHEMSCECMVVVIMIRNLMGFAINYGISPWVTNMGYQNCFITAAFVCLACFSTSLLMIATGPYWRKKSKNLYWNLVTKKHLREGITNI
ncbi:uncharacterized protein PRCAT00003510001 [Priceomyces carsonii]|uniref:uncharacterized protein n=1 Tax=Priceomyces carsonii TaxID=28549 RepID=UPI002ED8E9C1|nr:unnamed protein product [Priceomyces carsonii]